MTRWYPGSGASGRRDLQAADGGRLDRRPGEGERPEPARGPHRRLVVPVRRRRVAGDPRGEHALAAVEVGEVVDGSPRRSDVDVEGALALEPGVVHCLFVAAELVLRGDEERLEAGQPPERVREPSPGDRPPPPRGRGRAPPLLAA